MTPRPALTVATGLVALTAAALVHASGWASTTGTGHGAPASAPVVDRGTLPPVRPVAAGTKAPPRHGVVPPGSRLAYARLHIDAPIRATSVHHGVMAVPRDPHTVGWWTGGAGAGDAAGNVVVVGHVNYAGTAGVLGSLPQARPGDVVDVREPGRTVRYRVSAVRTYAKTSGIPRAAFASGGPAQLVLITCGGPFDASTGNYLDNIVVYAVPV